LGCVKLYFNLYRRPKGRNRNGKGERESERMRESVVGNAEVA